jgi:hypothetical protein
VTGHEGMIEDDSLETVAGISEDNDCSLAKVNELVGCSTPEVGETDSVWVAPLLSLEVENSPPAGVLLEGMTEESMELEEAIEKDRLEGITGDTSVLLLSAKVGEALEGTKFTLERLVEGDSELATELGDVSGE